MGLEDVISESLVWEHWTASPVLNTLHRPQRCVPEVTLPSPTATGKLPEDVGDIPAGIADTPAAHLHMR